MFGTLLKNKTLVGGFLLWFLAISTPLFFQNGRKYARIKERRLLVENTSNYISFFNTIPSKQQNKIYYSNLGLIKMTEKDFFLVGDENKTEDLIKHDKLVVKKIDYQIVDIKKLALRSALMDIRSKLNDAEKRLVSDFYGVILTNENDEFFLVLNGEMYQKYVEKYGTECKSCDK